MCQYWWLQWPLVNGGANRGCYDQVLLVSVLPNLFGGAEHHPAPPGYAPVSNRAHICQPNTDFKKVFASVRRCQSHLWLASPFSVFILFILFPFFTCVDFICCRILINFILFHCIWLLIIISAQWWRSVDWRVQLIIIIIIIIPGRYL